jgi:hypothetical protein
VVIRDSNLRFFEIIDFPTLSLSLTVTLLITFSKGQRFSDHLFPLLIICLLACLMVLSLLDLLAAIQIPFSRIEAHI